MLANCSLVPMFESGGDQPDEAFKIMEPALEVLGKETSERLDLAYHELIDLRAKCLEKKGRKWEAREEYVALHGALQKRGINEPVLRDVLKRADRLGE